MRSRLAVSCRLLFLLLAMIAALPPSVLALTASQVYEQVKDSVVVVKAYDRQGKPMGQASGVMLPTGEVITNYHVVKTGVRYLVSQGKKGVPATVKAGDPDKDLCLLTAPGLSAKPARLGKAARLKVGEPVYAVGAPQGLELSLSEGIVSQLRGGPPPLIQTTVAISQGSSGGGLFNAEGELVGITTFYLKDSQSLNFAVPVEWIAEVARGKNRERRPENLQWGVAEPPVPIRPKAPAGTWKNRAEVLEKSEDWPGLLAHSRRWTKAEPGNYSAWFNLGIAYGQMGRHREAVEANREALRLKPDYAMAWGNLAAAYANSGNRSAALEALREFRRYDPQKAEILFNSIMEP
jgi:hypothetical protein